LERGKRWEQSERGEMGKFYVRVAGVASFFFQAEDGIRDRNVTGVQTCALPISQELPASAARRRVTPDLVGEAEHPDLVALRDRDVAEHERGVHRMVELRERAERARHHPAGVEEGLHALLALGLGLDGDRAAAPRGRRPR